MMRHCLLNMSKLFLLNVGLLLYHHHDVVVVVAQSPNISSAFAIGDPHYRTFDGYFYDFQGPCDYVLLWDCTVSDLMVQTRNSNPSPLEGYPVTLVDRILMIIPVGAPFSGVFDRIEIGRDDDTSLLNGVLLTWQSTAVEYHVGEVLGYSLRKNNNLYVITIHFFELVITWDGYANVIMHMQPTSVLHGNLCGLAGNADGNAANDEAMITSGVDTSDFWLVPAGFSFFATGDSRDEAYCNTGIRQRRQQMDNGTSKSTEGQDPSTIYQQFRKAHQQKRNFTSSKQQQHHQHQQRPQSQQQQQQQQQQQPRPRPSDRRSTPNDTHAIESESDTATTALSLPRIRRQDAPGSCVGCDRDDEAALFCNDLAPGGIYESLCGDNWNIAYFFACTCDFCYDMVAAVGVFSALQQICITNALPEEPIVLPAPPDPGFIGLGEAEYCGNGVGGRATEGVVLGDGMFSLGQCIAAATLAKAYVAVDYYNPGVCTAHAICSTLWLCDGTCSPEELLGGAWEVGTFAPTPTPTNSPSLTLAPTQSPTTSPTTSPTISPTTTPTTLPSKLPSARPTTSPTTTPTTLPSKLPSVQPTTSPTTPSPTLQPLQLPTTSPTISPTTTSPTLQPTAQPTTLPTRFPSPPPNTEPTTEPTSAPTQQPSPLPSSPPTTSPTSSPTQRPSTAVPTLSPSILITLSPTRSTAVPTIAPTTSAPSNLPTTPAPTLAPVASTTSTPTLPPSTSVPSTTPTPNPTRTPSTSTPSTLPTSSPTMSPTLPPVSFPSPSPTLNTYELVDGRVGCDASPTHSALTSFLQCQEAARYLQLGDATARGNNGRSRWNHPHKCYYDNLRNMLHWNLDGDTVKAALTPSNEHRPNLCVVISVPESTVSTVTPPPTITIIVTTTTAAATTTTTTTTTEQPETTTHEEVTVVGSGSYVIANGNTGCVASGYFNIAEQAECLNAALALGYEATEADINTGGSRAKRPACCYFDINRLHLQFNLDSDSELIGTADNSERPSICIVASTTTTVAPATTVAPITTVAATTTVVSTNTVAPTTTVVATTTVEATIIPSTSSTPVEATTTTTGPLTPTTTTTTTNVELFEEYDTHTAGCSLGLAITSMVECDGAAAILGFEDTTATLNAQRMRTKRPVGCYYDTRRSSLQWNPRGKQQLDPHRPTLCRIPL